MKKSILVIAGLLLSSPVAFAHGDGEKHMDGQMAHNPCSMQSMKGMQGMKHNPCDMSSMQDMEKGMFLKKEVIDGYDVSFHIMKAPAGMEHGGTHHLMIKVEKNNKITELLAVNSRVMHPKGKSESKMMMKMGDWYMASYDLGHAGQHKLMVLFKTADGEKHFGGVLYPENKHQWHDEQDALQDE